MEGYKGGGEVRRVHVLYFLSRNGSIEQPHLIRIHHLHRNGVCLRDVKRWLADLRGKDMPESFSWSYKRRYKSGHVWQDLMDDELITPISDNEYVLKGSELSSKTDLPLAGTISSDEEAKDSPASKSSHKSTQIETDKSDQGSPGALVPPPPISSSDVSDESTERASIIKIDPWKQQLGQEIEKKHKTHKEKEERVSSASTRNTYYSRSGRKTSKLFHNLFKCGGAGTKDTVLMTVQRQDRYQAVSGGSYERKPMLSTQKSIANGLR